MSKQTFEEAVVQLGDIVRKLDTGSTSLDEAMELFEKGIKLTKECNKMLDEAEQKVNILIKNADGSVTAEQTSKEELE